MTYAQGYPSSPGISATTRPMNEAERRALNAIPKPQRNNAIGISIMSMVMAIMVNFVEDQIAIIMPLFFCFAGLGLALQARKSSGAVAQAVAKGTVTDVGGVPRFKGASGWELGTLRITKDRQLEGALVDGVPATVTISTETKRLLSVNGVTMRKPVTVTIPPGFEATIAIPATPQQPRWASTVPDEDLPPPPDGYEPSACPGCGKAFSGEGMFCERCGLRLRP